LGQKAALMPGVKLTTSACDGHILVALSGELDLTGAADAEAAIRPWWRAASTWSST
jgi:hypothetical protein